jgi:putative NADH-flavin reductase
MKIALIGGSGFVGKAIARELLDRGHIVTAISRNPGQGLAAGETVGGASGGRITGVKGDVFEVDKMAGLLKGHDAVVSAYNPGWTNPEIYADFMRGSAAIQEAVKRSGVRRLIVIGGAGSLYIKPGVQLVDTPQFPAEYKAGATAARDYLDVLRKEKDLDWTFFSPAIFMNPETAGVRRGQYRLGLENPVFDEAGRSVLSVEDLAVAIVDELEHPKHIKQRFTAGY